MWKPLMWMMVVLVAAVLGVSSSDESLNYVVSFCDDQRMGNYTANSTYGANLNTLLTKLKNQASITPFGSDSQGAEADDQVYGQYYCRGDVGVRVCTNCLRDAAQRLLEECALAKSAIMSYEECTLRYSNRSMLSTQENGIGSLSCNMTNVTDQGRFPDVLNATMGRLINESAYGDGFSRMGRGSNPISEREMMYCQVQCSPDLNSTQCYACLTSLVDWINQFDMGAPVRMYAFYPSCQLMYNVTAYQNSSLLPPRISPPLSQPPPITLPGKGNKHLVAVYIALPVLATLSLLFVLGFSVYRKNRRHFSHDKLAEITRAESLQFDISTIRSATDNFSPAFKLGQGGFGSVYKGNLQNGQEIAVKRLFQKSQEGIEEFKNEVLFVAKLQHRNLVKLLGYCLTGREKLLIFEFLPNLSLDNFLNDVSKRSGLDWETRYKIILGVARGLLYLHEDSRLKIIHRDMKPQNILLDEAMNPKIADFGLAKSFNLDQSIANTHTIVGTYGYMSPEYAMGGHFSTKSDVYSFGVIVLEVVSGKRNIIQENHPSLFHQTWKLWMEGNALHIIDPALNNTYSAEEALACIHIGLLCIQEEPGSRPTMAKVVSLLNGHSTSLPEPSPPLIFTFNEDGSEIKYSSVMISHDMSDEQLTQDKQQQI